MNSREKTLSVIVAAAALAWLAVSFVFAPLTEGNREREELLRARTIKLHKLKNDVKKSEMYRSNIPDIEKLPRPGESVDKDNALLLKAIDEIQKKSGIQITNYIPQPAETQVFYKRLLVKVEIEDTMPGILKFIQELKSAPGQLNIANLRILPGDRKKELLKATLTVAQLMALK